MKALVTGGKGFVGTHLIAHLLEEGYEVIAIDHQSGKEQFDIPYYVCNIREEKLSAIFEIEKPDFIFHLAAQSSVPISMKYPFEDAGTNVLGTVQLLENAVRYGAKKIVFASSAAVYGIPELLPMSENHPLQPTSFYGLSKVIGENYISMYGKESSLEYAILRFANIYGSGQQSNGGIITRMFHCAIEKKPLYIYGDGSQTRDFIYVKDIVKACENSIPNSSGIFNISSGVSISINELINYINAITGNPLMIHYMEARTGDIDHSCLENNLARQQLSWNPDYNIQQGLENTLEAIEKTIYKGV